MKNLITVVHLIQFSFLIGSLLAVAVPIETTIISEKFTFQSGLNSTAVTPDEFKSSPGSNEIMVSKAWDGRTLCETTSGSPQLRDVLRSIDKLAALPEGTPCRQLNNFGSGCTKMTITNSAEIGICGQHGAFIYCSYAARALRQVAVDCQWNGLTGATRWLDNYPSLRLIIYHA